MNGGKRFIVVIVKTENLIPTCNNLNFINSSTNIKFQVLHLNTKTLNEFLAASWIHFHKSKGIEQMLFVHSFIQWKNGKQRKRTEAILQLYWIDVCFHPSEDILFTLIDQNLKNFWLLWAIILLWCFIMQTFSDGINCQSFLKDFKKTIYRLNLRIVKVEAKRNQVICLSIVIHTTRSAAQIVNGSWDEIAWGLRVKHIIIFVSLHLSKVQRKLVEINWSIRHAFTWCHENSSHSNTFSVDVIVGLLFHSVLCG